MGCHLTEPSLIGFAVMKQSTTLFKVCSLCLLQDDHLSGSSASLEPVIAKTGVALATWIPVIVIGGATAVPEALSHSSLEIVKLPRFPAKLGF